MKEVDDYWKNIQPIDTHAREYQMVNILNNHFINTRFPYKVERVIRDDVENMYSEYDADVYEFNWNTLQKGKVIVKIDFERKPKAVFCKRMSLTLEICKLPFTQG